MPPRIREAELTRSIGEKDNHIIPVLRCHIIDADECDTDAIFTACTGITYSFSEYGDAKNPQDSCKELLTISCLGAKVETGILVEQRFFLRFPILITRILGDKFRKQLEETGLWWFLVRFDEAKEFISFTVDLNGIILGRHIISLDGDLIVSKHDGTVH